MDISKNALLALRRLLEESSIPNGIILVSALVGCCTPTPHVEITGQVNANDRLISVEGLAIYIDRLSADSISGYTLDFNANGFRFDLLFPAGRCCR